MKAWTVVGPTKRQPRRFSSFDSAIDAGVVASSFTADQVTRRGRSEAAGSKRQRKAASDPRLVDQRAGATGVLDRRLDLPAVADDAGIAQEPRHVPRAEAGDPLEVEAVEDLPEPLPLAEDRQPGEPRLEALEGELLEEPAVVGHRPSPLLVVVGEVVGR